MTRGSSRRSPAGACMANPFECSVEFDELGPDDSIIDYCFVRDGHFLLVILLTSNGTIQAYWELARDRTYKRTKDVRHLCSRHADPLAVSVTEDASTVVFALSDSSILIVPIKLLLEVNWCGGGTPSTSSTLPLSDSFHLVDLPSSADSCLQVPTTIACFRTNNPPRSAAVVGTKAGDIFIIDLQIRKCIVEMKAPQSVHECEIVKDGESISLLVTGYTFVQWLIPLETPGKNLWEVLCACIPSDLKMVSTSNARLIPHHPAGVLSINTQSRSVELYPTIPTVGTISVKRYTIPSETWMVCWTNVALFTISNDSDLRCAIHMSLTTTTLRLEYTVVRGSPNWRPLAMLQLPDRPNSLPSILLINERGMTKISQQPDVSLQEVASQLVFRCPPFSHSLLSQVAKAAALNESTFQNKLVSNIVNSRVKAGGDLQPQKYKSVFNSQELIRLLDIAKHCKTRMEEVIDMFAAADIEEQLLPEVLKKIDGNRKSELRFRVVEMYCKKVKAMQDKGDWEVGKLDADNSLSSFLLHHTDVSEGCVSCAEAHLWKSATILSQRDSDSSRLLRYVCKNMNALRKSNHLIAHQVIGSVCQLDWSVLTEKEFSDLVSLLCVWQKDLGVFTHLETLLRLSKEHAAKYPVPCEVLYLVMSLFILHEQSKEVTKSIMPSRVLAAGLHSSACITSEHKLMVFGDFTNAQHRQVETSDIGVKGRKNGENTPNSTPSTPVRKVVQLPKILSVVSGQPHSISCGTEHLLMITSDGNLWAWGGNRYGQCGLGHRENIREVEKITQAPERVEDLAAGQFHSALVDADGSLWTWGWGVWGQLGRGGRSIEDILAPTKVDGFKERVKTVRCGRAHTVILTESGRVMVSGNGSYGQLGDNEDLKKRYAFEYLDIDNHKFTHIATAFYHSVAVTDEGKIFEWGRNPQEVKMKMFLMRRLRSAQQKNATGGENENGTDQPIITKEKSAAMEKPSVLLPMEMPREDLGVREVQHFLDGPATCLSTGLSHSALITDQGSLYTWGKALEYQLGHACKTERFEPHQVFEPTNTKWSTVACGGNHTLAVSREGLVYGWGRNDFGQAGLPADKTPATPRKYFYQAKEGTKRSIQLPDDSVFVTKPTCVVQLQLKGDTAVVDANSMLDEKELMEKLKTTATTSLQTVCRLLDGGDKGPMDSIPVALVHLMAGEVEAAVEMIGRLKQEHNQDSEPLRELSSLAWQIVANHEDVQSRKILTAAFKSLPMSNTMKRGSQLAHLWPTVWDSEDAQSALSVDEKLAMLDSWNAPIKTANNVVIPSSSLQTPASTTGKSSNSISSTTSNHPTSNGGNTSSSSSTRLRVYAPCGHAEQAAIGGSGMIVECPVCAEEWRQKLIITLL